MNFQETIEPEYKEINIEYEIDYSQKISELEKILKEEKEKENNEIENEEFNQKINAIKLKQNKELEELNQERLKLEQNNINNNIKVDMIEEGKNILINKVNQQLDNYYEEYNKVIGEKIYGFYNDFIEEKFKDIFHEFQKSNNEIFNDCNKKQKLIFQNITEITKELNIKDINNNELNNNELNNNELNYNNINELKKKNSNDMNKDNNIDNNNENIDNNQDEMFNEIMNLSNTHKKIYIKNPEKFIIKNTGNKGKNGNKNNNINNNENIRNINVNDFNFNQNSIIEEGSKDRINKNNNINNKIAQIKNEEENIQEKEPDDNKRNYIINNNLKPKTSSGYYNKNSGTGFLNNINQVKNQPIIVKNIDGINEVPLLQKKPNQEMNSRTTIKKPRKLYTSMEKFFFKDNQQKRVKIEKISDIEKEEIEKELVNEMRKGGTNLKAFCLNYIEINVLPIFKKYKLNDEQRRILQYNIETILQCCGEDKNKYMNAYYPELNNKKKEIDRRKSVEALRKFRKEFNVSEKDFNDEGIIKRLEENDLDIYKTFQKIFGV